MSDHPPNPPHPPHSHEDQINELRGRQLALIRRLSPEDAIAVLEAEPVTHAEGQDIIANIIQRNVMLDDLEKRRFRHG